MSEILCPLVAVASPRSGSSDQRQPHGVVIRFVGSILAIREHRSTKASALIGEVDPLMRRDFKLALRFVRTLNRADVPVVRSHIVAGAQWECGLQVRFFGVPLCSVAEL